MARVINWATKPEHVTTEQREIIRALWSDRSKSLTDIGRECAKGGAKTVTGAVVKTLGFSMKLGKRPVVVKKSHKINPNRFGFSS